MSLHSEPIGPVPEETARVARAAFPHGSTWQRLRDDLGSVYRDETFASLFPTHGRPAEAPWRLALITEMQFAEGLSDRQAAETVRARIDWKYALGLELTDAGFDFSVLSEFRTRLVRGGAGTLLEHGPGSVMGAFMAWHEREVIERGGNPLLVAKRAPDL